MDFAEGFAGARVLDGFIEGALGQADGLSGDADAAAIESGESDLQAAAFFAETIVCGDYAIVENDFDRRERSAGPFCLRGGRS